MNLITGLKSLFRKSRIEREMDEELDGYLAASTADKQRRGLSPESARRLARIEMGSPNSVKQQLWQSRWESALDNLQQDIRFSFRSLAKSPGFTLIALLSLALGIGANTAIFTLIHQVMLRNLPVSHPEQLVSMGESNDGGILGGVDLGFYDMFSWSFAKQLEANPGPFQGIASYGSFSDNTNVRLPGAASSSPAVLAQTSLVSGNYFSILGAQPFMGRTISPSDDATPGSGAVGVVSHHFWQQSLSSDPSILGKTITLNGTPFAIIGVMPATFHGLKLENEAVELWTPLSMQSVVMSQPSFLNPYGPYFLHLFARVNFDAARNKPALAQAQSWLDAQIHASIRAAEGSKLTPAREQEINRETETLFPAARGVSQIRQQYGESLKILMAVVALVLLIACANLANFLLARAATRQREISTRLALGSSRARIIRQSLIETLLLSLTGGLLGLGVAFLATRALIAFVSQGRTYVAMTSNPDLSVLLFTLAVSLLTGLLFGLAPAFNAARSGSSASLSSSTRTTQSSGGKSSRFWPKILVTIQVMLSLVLLVGAGLFLRTLNNLQNRDYGFERNRLLLADFNAKLVGYKPSQTPALNQSLLERVSALPGVQSAALCASKPISGGNWTSNITLSGYIPAPKEDMVSLLNRVSGKFFETAGIKIVAGRAIADSDSATSLKVAVVSQALASHFFPHGDALGKTLTIGIDTVKGPWRIVGIARDTVSQGPRETDPARMTYIPVAQIEPFNPIDPKDTSAKTAPREENQDRFVGTILVRTDARTTTDPATSIADVRRAFAQVDPNLPLIRINTIEQEIDGYMTQDKLISSLTVIFSLLALLLAAIGLYGVMSYNVVRRTNEIGIRLALGAQSNSVLWMVLRESITLLAIGLGLGLPLVLLSTRLTHDFLKDQLFGITALDPWTFTTAIAVITSMTLLAAWLPARRAAHVDPMIALRCD